jgi:thioesterase domain-containing protein
MPAGVDLAYLRRFVDTARANLRALAGYEPLRSDLPVHLFRAAQKLGELDDNLSDDLGWAEVVDKSLVIHETPGDHITMMSGDQVKQLSALLQDVMAKTTTAPPEPAGQLLEE